MSAVVLIGVVDSRKRWYIQRCAGLWCSQFAVKTSGWKFGELRHIGLGKQSERHVIAFYTHRQIALSCDILEGT